MANLLRTYLVNTSPHMDVCHLNYDVLQLELRYPTLVVNVAKISWLNTHTYLSQMLTLVPSKPPG